MSGIKESERTKLLIKKVFLRYCNEKNQKPNVKELCAQIGINRGTFYNHYESIDDLVSTLMNEADDTMDVHRSWMKNDLYKAVYDITNVFLKEREIMLVLLNPDLGFPYRNEIKTSIQLHFSQLLYSMNKQDRDYISEFASNGILNTTHKWIKEQVMDHKTFVNFLYSMITKLIA